MLKAALAGVVVLFGTWLAWRPESSDRDSKVAEDRVASTPVKATSYREGPTALLFNGRDLAGWQHLGGGRVSVQDGMLVLESDTERRSGYLMSDFTAKDFIVRFRCRVEAGDSGLIFRGRRQPRTPSELMGPQVQLNMSPDRGLGGVYESHHRGWLRKPEPSAVRRALRDDGCLDGELLARGNEMRITINGVTTTHFVDESFGNFFPGPGCFGLQIHGGGPCRVRFASITVQLVHEVDVSRNVNTISKEPA